jgi:hypothetical protein
VQRRRTPHWPPLSVQQTAGKTSGMNKKKKDLLNVIYATSSSSSRSTTHRESEGAEEIYFLIALPNAAAANAENP